MCKSKMEDQLSILADTDKSIEKSSKKKLQSKIKSFYMVQERKFLTFKFVLDAVTTVNMNYIDYL